MKPRTKKTIIEDAAFRIRMNFGLGNPVVAALKRVWRNAYARGKRKGSVAVRNSYERYIKRQNKPLFTMQEAETILQTCPTGLTAVDKRRIGIAKGFLRHGIHGSVCPDKVEFDFDTAEAILKRLEGVA